ncbi:efflux RND transporter permease subunit [Parvibaculum sp.]|uniref:efflux RND transporter permease subunit n=1 Tax=Parvibaculum sp. TaxID=2024848 RepID=UPI002B8B5D9A|nr:efflux RND transporter permease subunit [Parvibaculum sp.]HUD51866.1 efflux RND transporter permease subunit [Parvibaculum sp.]
MQRIENIVFGLRAVILAILAVVTVVMLFFAVQLRMDAGFLKMLPVGNSFIQTYFQYADGFGGGNRVIVVLENKKGDIFTPEFLKTLKDATDDVFYIPGVARHRVTSLWTPNTRYIAVTEEGLEAGDVIPANFQPTPEGIKTVMQNVLRANLVGRLVSTDFRSAMIATELLEYDPETREKLDYFKVANLLEQKIRDKYVSNDTDVKIVGFAKLVGDIAAGAQSVVIFFAVAFVLTCLMLWLYCRSWILTIVTVSCSLCSLIWQFGTLHLMGYGLDPLAVLVPFLVFAIGVSHGVQQINMVGAEIAAGLDKNAAARATFTFLLRPGSVALATCLAGFATLYIIPIGMIRELAVTASIGVMFKIISNLVMLPLIVSYVAPGAEYGDKVRRAMEARAKFWPFLASIAKPTQAFVFIGFCVVLGAVALYESRDRQIGDVHAGAGELWPNARYNLDSEYIADHFKLGLNVMNVIVESKDVACVDYDKLHFVDTFAWDMRNVPGVQTVVSLPAAAKIINSMWQEGNPKWAALPRDPTALAQATSSIASSTLLVDQRCMTLGVQIYVADTKAETVKTVTHAVEAWINDPKHQRDDLKLRIGTGNVTITSATNTVVEHAELPMLLYVYAVVMTLVIFVYREWRGALCCVIPLILSTIIGNWFLTAASIGLKISTLPVLAIAVGIGVDYGIYEYNRIQRYMRMGVSPYNAYLQALNDVGSATMFTGGTLAIGVSTWTFSALKFQADMGLLLTFMFIVNMIGAVTLLPALVAALEYIWPLKRKPLTEEEARAIRHAH